MNSDTQTPRPTTPAAMARLIIENLRRAEAEAEQPYKLPEWLFAPGFSLKRQAE